MEVTQQVPSPEPQRPPRPVLRLPRCLSRALGFPKRLRPVPPFCFCLFLSPLLPCADAPLSEEAADSGSEASPPGPPLPSPSALRGPGFSLQWSSGEVRGDTRMRELPEQEGGREEESARWGPTALSHRSPGRGPQGGNRQEVHCRCCSSTSSWDLGTEVPHLCGGGHGLRMLLNLVARGLGEGPSGPRESRGPRERVFDFVGFPRWRRGVLGTQ